MSCSRRYFFVIIAAVLFLLTKLGFGTRRTDERLLRITIPENLDYDGLFDDLFATYTTAHTLERVKTANMGTLYELQYRVTLRDAQVSKGLSRCPALPQRQPEHHLQPGADG